jgi:hypothetical protein
MRYYSFKNWLEYADFGLDVNKKPVDQEMKNQDKPLMPLNVEYVINALKKTVLGEKYVIPNDFFGELQWGQQDGALRISFSNFGGNRVILRRLVHDLAGDPQWLCQKVIEVKNFYDDQPDKLTYEIREVLNKLDYEEVASPMREFEDMQRFVILLASDLRRKTSQKIFMYEGIRVLKENEKYLIHFGVTGNGVQRRGQKRLDQFAIHVEYHKNTGLVKITGTPLGDKIDKHRWIYDPSSFIEFFSPAQKGEIINNAVLAHFNCY